MNTKTQEATVRKSRTVQEPVAFTNVDELSELKSGMTTCYMYKEAIDKHDIPLYTHPAPSCNGEWSEKIMKQWDDIRKLIANGDTSSYPRDWFESLAPSWQGLSVDERYSIIKELSGYDFDADNYDVAVFVEQALKEKNEHK